MFILWVNYFLKLSAKGKYQIVSGDLKRDIILTDGKAVIEPSKTNQPRKNYETDYLLMRPNIKNNYIRVCSHLSCLVQLKQTLVRLLC